MAKAKATTRTVYMAMRKDTDDEKLSDLTHEVVSDFLTDPGYTGVHDSLDEAKMYVEDQMLADDDYDHGAWILKVDATPVLEVGKSVKYSAV
jgi:hypothetical protein